MTSLAVETTVLIPVYRGGDRWRLGELMGHAIVDDEWAHLGDMRWRLSPDGYAVRTHRPGDGTKQQQSMHRVILGLELGNPLEGDHINGNRLDNRRANLRAVTMLIQGQNKRPHKKGRSRFRGVAHTTGAASWSAYTSIDGKRVHLGCFKTEEEAGEVARAARLKYMPGAVD